MNWEAFLAAIVVLAIAFILGCFLLLYLKGDFTIKEQKLLGEKGIFRRIPYTWNDREQVGTIYIYEITYESGRKKIKKIKL